MSNRAIRVFLPISAVYDSIRFTMELETNGCMPLMCLFNVANLVLLFEHIENPRMQVCIW